MELVTPNHRMVLAGSSIEPEYIARLRARNVYGGAGEKWRQDLNEKKIRDVDVFEKRFGY